ncbi:YihA family ribosome biogenesis GTP-binding protein|nr:ribosome biogenesis GTP-binding protein YihA/YsxC [Dendrosporobacter quercicolus]NSL47241.1 YihA family ribosome biogenesis GTP-binding protein [Dendrosporobacter quercicolus DSM 1736]
MTVAGLDIIRAQYIASAVRMDQYPAGDFGEIVFIGRSNVGKSSLINSLSRHRGLARISGTPGKTQTINFYQLTARGTAEERTEFFLVDLPGYGYAKTGQANRRQWSRFIEEYLLKSPRLKLVCQLIDIRHPPMASDVDMHKWLVANQLPVQVITTKADKISKMAVQKQAGIIKKALGMTGQPSMIVYSSLKGTGRQELLDVIGQTLLK